MTVSVNSTQAYLVYFRFCGFYKLTIIVHTLIMYSVLK